MKKIIATIMLAMVITIFSPIVPQAHAASIGDIADLAAQDSTASRIQDLIKVKQELEKGNKEAVLNVVAKAAQAQIAKSKIGSVMVNDDVKQVVETALRQKLEQKVSEQLAPYQEKLDILNLFLNSGSTLNPDAVRENNSLTGAPQNYSRVLDVTATAYGPGPLDNGKWNDLTYMGGKVRKGVVAVDPNVIPMGTRLWVEGYGEAVAEDQGSAIKGSRIDLAFDNRQEALDYGIQKVKVYVLN